jgi:hypothetical protein
VAVVVVGFSGLTLLPGWALVLVVAMFSGLTRLKEISSLFVRVSSSESCV